VIRALVVDDDFRVAEVHAAYVEKVPGFSVVGQAHSAGALFEAISRLSPELVLLDLYLPDLHGLEVLRRLRAAAAPVDVIVITAANDVASVRAAMQGGALHYLLKPFDFAALEAKLLAYQAMRNQLAAAPQADQPGVDKLFGALAEARARPAGLAGPANHTLAAVESVLAERAEKEEGVSAAEVAERLGISRTTAQRYLARLEALSLASVRPRYGKAGRPENRYIWSRA
jgi:response regulator of citrate/malate metabolism